MIKKEIQLIGDNLASQINGIYNGKVLPDPSKKYLCITDANIQDAMIECHKKLLENNSFDKKFTVIAISKNNIKNIKTYDSPNKIKEIPDVIMFDDLADTYKGDNTAKIYFTNIDKKRDDFLIFHRPRNYCDYYNKIEITFINKSLDFQDIMGIINEDLSKIKDKKMYILVEDLKSIDKYKKEFKDIQIYTPTDISGKTKKEYVYIIDKSSFQKTLPKIGEVNCLINMCSKINKKQLYKLLIDSDKCFLFEMSDNINTICKQIYELCDIFYDQNKTKQENFFKIIDDIETERIVVSDTFTPEIIKEKLFQKLQSYFDITSQDVKFNNRVNIMHIVSSKTYKYTDDYFPVKIRNIVSGNKFGIVDNDSIKICEVIDIKKSKGKHIKIKLLYDMSLEEFVSMASIKNIDRHIGKSISITCL